MDEELQNLKCKAIAEPENAEVTERFLHRLARATNHLSDCDYIRYYLQTEGEEISFKRAVDEYIEKWPDHCEDCSGWGGHLSYYDPSPSGIELSAGNTEDFEPCESCLEEDTCPRCGETAELEDVGEHQEHYVCDSCGWVDGKEDGMPLDSPLPIECSCWEQNLDLL